MAGKKKTQKTNHLKRKISEEESQDERAKRRHQQTSSDSSTDGPFIMTNHLQEQEFPLSSSFQVQRSLGQGNFGNVYLMKDRGSKKKLALKVIMMRKDRPNKMHEEKKALEETSGCPFIIKTHLTMQTENFFWIAMEFAPGGDFRHLINEGFHFDLDEIRFYTAEIMTGLQHLHGKGFIHRDIKMENILLGADGHVRIADFGVAIEAEVVRGYVGTPGYMAPEIVKGKQYNAAVDYYSLGVMLYRMATRESEVAYWSPAFMKLDHRLLDLIKKLLRKNPKKRWGFGKNLQTHPFFQNINWDDVQNLEAPPPFIPW